MMYLIDTHILLWAFFATEKLSKKIADILADVRNTIYYSPVSLWEISIKYSLGKLSLGRHTPETFFEKLSRTSLKLKTLAPEQIVSSYNLPKVGRHNDPFDRLLIWQAIRNDLIMLSGDTDFAAYMKYGLRLEV